ncbi:hypothetical protein GCM10025867_47720 (plasmid) [Frondihabitans sucicola]|uniref:Uncharacterized protein n=1 Tax=Frondihabitans sucicola TaxID=1268041 RepID=A0ABM8GVN6_9MICO|nr:hypothetical protein GCM10025867_47720 [Frondihabitans sucicola]
MPKTDPRERLARALKLAAESHDWDTPENRDAIYAAQATVVETEVLGAVTRYAEITLQHCERRHQRGKVSAPCANCAQRIHIAETIGTVLFPPLDME